MSQDLLSGDIENSVFPGQLVWSGYVLPGASPVPLTLEPGLYQLIQTPSAANGQSGIVLPNSWGSISLINTINGSVWVRLQETSVTFSPAWGSINLPMYMGALPSFQGGTFIHDGTNYGVVVNYSPTADNTTRSELTYWYSTDLVTWSSRLINDAFVYSYPNQIWTESKSFVYDPTGPSAKYFVAVGPNNQVGSNHIHYSTDSITWSSSAIPGAPTQSTNGWYILVNPNATNRYVAFQPNTTANTQLATSTDGITWTSRTYLGTSIYNIATNGTASTNQIYVVANNSTTTQLGTSTDGITWTSRTLAFAGSYWVVWFASKYWLVSNSGYANSTDGVTWSIGVWPSSFVQSNNAPIMMGSRLFTTGVFTHNWSSTDGVTWRPEGGAYGSPMSYANGKLFLNSSQNFFVNDVGSYLRLYRLDNQVV